MTKSVQTVRMLRLVFPFCCFHATKSGFLAMMSIYERPHDKKQSGMCALIRLRTDLASAYLWNLMASL